MRLAVFAAVLVFACAPPESSEQGDVLIDYFEANTTDAAISGLVHLRWKITNGEYFQLLSYATPTADAVPVIGYGTNFEDELDVRVNDDDTTFKMLAFGEGGPVVKRQRIDVDEAVVRVTSFDASASFARLGESVTLSWVTEGAFEIRVVEGEVELYRSTEGVLEGSHAVVISEREHNFTLEAIGMEKTDAKTIVVRGDAPPRIEALEVRPHAFRPGLDNVEVSWIAEGDSFELATQGMVEASGSRTLTITNTTDYTLVAGTGSAAIRRTATAFAVEQEIEPNDAPASAQSLAFSGATGAIDPSTDSDVYAVGVPAGGAVFVETEDGGGGCRADTVVRLLGLGGVELARDDDGGAPLASGLGGCSRIGPITELAGGIHHIEVRGSGGPYVLIVRTIAAGCGNSLRETNEACDDGNTIDGDGCSAACAFEPVVAPGRTVIVDVADHRAPSRTIAIDAGEGASISIHTQTGTAESAATCEIDLFVALYDGAGTMLGEDVGPGCASIDPARDPFAKDLAGGRYLVKIGNRGGGQGGLVAAEIVITERNP